MTNVRTAPCRSTGGVFFDSPVGLGNRPAHCVRTNQVTTTNGMAIRIAGDWFSFNTKLKGWSVTGGIGGSFAAFGLAEIAPGFVSLDFSGNQQGGRATARIRIPLN